MVTSEVPLRWTAETWPIAAAMIQYPNQLPDGTSVQDQGAEQWHATLREVAEAGFSCVDPTDSWLRLADLDETRRNEFLAVTESLKLTIPALTTARRSPIDPDHGEDNLAYLHRVVDAAAALRIPLVSISFMRGLAPAQQEALWFWTAQGPVDPPDDLDAWRAAVERVRAIGDHAQRVGVQVSLEMYEDTYLGSADSAVRFIEDVGHSSVGLNPDLANLFRLHRPIEHWKSMVRKTVPYANYWHVKNYFRTEDATTGAVVTAPAPLELGVMSYRYAVQYAVIHGFRGPFCTEHYGGDGLSVSATNRDYLRRILPSAIRAEEAVAGAGPDRAEGN